MSSKSQCGAAMPGGASCVLPKGHEREVVGHLSEADIEKINELQKTGRSRCRECHRWNVPELDGGDVCSDCLFDMVVSSKAREAGLTHWDPEGQS